jgi:hypothetical protein
LECPDLPPWVAPDLGPSWANHPARLDDGMTRPELWQILADGRGIRWASDALDIYDLLTEYGNAVRLFPHSDDLAGIVLFTSGWAAPMPEDGSDFEGAPSTHALRRRVYLAVCVDERGTASRLRFADVSEVVDDEEGGATGSLADAVAETLAPLWGRK